MTDPTNLNLSTIDREFAERVYDALPKNGRDGFYSISAITLILQTAQTLSAPSGPDLGEGVELLRRALAYLPSTLGIAQDIRAFLSTPSSTLTPDADPAGDGKLPLQGEVEKVLLRRLYAKQLEGFTLATAHEIASLLPTPAIRDQAFEEAALELEHYGLDIAAYRVRALKGTPPSKTVDPTSGEDALLGSRDNFHSQQGDRS